VHRCWFCVTTWVDHACSLADVQMTELERRRLIAALLSRQNLILSGPVGIGKGRLARALSLSCVNGEQARVCFLQGHPWWAANTANVSRFVELQTDHSLWRLAHFAYSAVNGEGASSRNVEAELPEAAGRNGRDDRPADRVCAYVACVERISPFEIELYFRVVAEWLLRNGTGESKLAPLRLLGTFDSPTPPDLDDRILHITGFVHLSGAQDTTPADSWPETGVVTRTLP
jgi:hypothetical protein